MFGEQQLREQYGEKNVQVAKNFSGYSSYLAPIGFMITVKRDEPIKSPLPFNPDQLMSGIAVAEVPSSFKAQAPEKWKLDKKHLFGGMDGSIAQLVSCHCQDSTGHHLTEKKYVVVKAGVPEEASKACEDLERNLINGKPGEEYTWESFFRSKKIDSLRDSAIKKRQEIAREFLVGIGACSAEQAAEIKVSTDITTHNIVVPTNDKKHLFVCSDVVPPSSITKGMVIFEGPMLGVRVFSGTPDGTLFGKGFLESTKVIPASYGLESLERRKKTDFENSMPHVTALKTHGKKNIFHFCDTWKKPNTKLLSEVRLNGRDPEWPETFLRAEAVYIA